MVFAETVPPTFGGLEFVNWIFWATLTGGTLLMVGLTEWFGGTSPGYRRFMAATVFVGAVIWLLSELAFDVVPEVAADDTPRRGLIWLFTALAASYLATTTLDLPKPLRVAASVGGGIVSLLVLLDMARLVDEAGSTDGDQALLFAAGLVSASLALGSVTAGMLLGHWYLVTPKLSPDPIRRLIWLLIAALVVQGLLVGWSVVIAWGVIEPVAWLTGLRFFVGVVFPLAIAILALRASTAPSMQSTTGLLYIGLAAVMAGTIGAVSLVYLGWGVV
jgi:hypothetical protein